VADQFPELVREIDAAGHEIGSHSYWHRLVYQQTPEEFREDLRRSIDVLASVTGRPVRLYRAPTFSITRKSQWALEILVEEGIEIDSSIFPLAGHDRYGIPGIQRQIHQIDTPAGPIWEAPMSVAEYFGRTVPASGGGYFRLYPLALNCHLFRRVLGAGRPVIFYLHPWEIDPAQPRPARLPRLSHWRHYVNLHRTSDKLDTLLKTFPFGTLGSLVAAEQQLEQEPALSI
jgi:polysaccharide deacetylase family protein (PEP-CTERM system associated)